MIENWPPKIALPTLPKNLSRISNKSFYLTRISSIPGPKFYADNNMESYYNNLHGIRTSNISDRYETKRELLDAITKGEIRV